MEAMITPETFPLADVALQFLVKVEGGEPLAFRPEGPRALQVGLEALFASGLPAAPALEELLGLAFVLDEERGCPAAASTIRRAVENDARALSALGISTTDGVGRKRGAAHLIGGAATDRAPVYGAAAPEGAKRAAKLIDPLTLERARHLGNRAAAERAPAPTPKEKSPVGGSKARRQFGVD